MDPRTVIAIVAIAVAGVSAFYTWQTQTGGEIANMKTELVSLKNQFAEHETESVVLSNDELESKVSALQQKVDKLAESNPTAQISEIGQEIASLNDKLAKIKTQSSLRFWESTPFEVQPGTDYTINHGRQTAPKIVNLWFSGSLNGPWSLMDGIYTNSTSYGSWIINSNANNITVSTGIATSTSSYGTTNHWRIIDHPNGNNTQKRFLKVSLIY